MKTLIATMAVLFTMATAANATTREPLGDCLIGAFVETLSIEHGIKESAIVEFLMSEAGRSQREQILNDTENKVNFIVVSKMTGESLQYVRGLLYTAEDAYDALVMDCVTDYYSESA